MDKVRWTTLLLNWNTQSGRTLHAKLAEAFRNIIDSGKLHPDEILPAERVLSGLIGVSRSTVVAAYDNLAAEQWLVRKRGSGTRVAMNAPRQTHTPTLHTPIHVQPDHNFYDGEIDFTMAVPILSAAQKIEMREAAEYAFQRSVYAPLGIAELRELLANQYTAEGLPTHSQQVIVTSGAQQAIALVVSCLLRQGDYALLETPTYFGAIDVFKASGAHLLGVNVGSQGISPSEFFQAVQRYNPRLAFLTPTFHNPTGSVLPTLARAELADHLTQTNLPTIEDDTLIDLGFEQHPPKRIAHYAPDAAIFNVGSLSKLYWAGLRVGWMRIPEPFAETVKQAKTLSDFGSSLPSQYIALQLLQHLPRLQAERRMVALPTRDILVHQLKTHLPQWKFSVPTGGQFLWVELPTPCASPFIHHAMRYGVRLFSGASMGVHPITDRYLRLPFTLTSEQITLGVQRLQEAWNSFSPYSNYKTLV